MEIGALMVGKISNHLQMTETRCVKAGSEKGYFEFGGSTIILLLSPNAVCLRKKLFAKKNSDGEIPVSIGQALSQRLK